MLKQAAWHVPTVRLLAVVHEIILIGSCSTRAADKLRLLQMHRLVPKSIEQALFCNVAGNNCVLLTYLIKNPRVRNTCPSFCRGAVVGATSKTCAVFDARVLWRKFVQIKTFTALTCRYIGVTTLAVRRAFEVCILWRESVPVSARGAFTCGAIRAVRRAFDAFLLWRESVPCITLTALTCGYIFGVATIAGLGAFDTRLLWSHSVPGCGSL